MSIHGTAITFGETGVLIRGAPGSGKSTLALHLIDTEGYGSGNTPLRAKLVADDQVELESDCGSIIASPPPSLAGLLELRGLGLMPFPHQPSTRLALIVDIVPDAKVERLPEKPFSWVALLGVNLPGIVLGQTDIAGPAKLRSSLSHIAAWREEIP